jgi:Protein of unknown function (DUF3288)
MPNPFDYDPENAQELAKEQQVITMPASLASRITAHPQWGRDSVIIDRLKSIAVIDAQDFDYCEVARMIIRYEGFIIGDPQINKDLQAILSSWGETKNSLFKKTRELYSRPMPVYGGDSSRKTVEGDMA